MFHWRYINAYFYCMHIELFPISEWVQHQVFLFFFSQVRRGNHLIFLYGSTLCLFQMGDYWCLCTPAWQGWRGHSKIARAMLGMHNYKACSSLVLVSPGELFFALVCIRIWWTSTCFVCIGNKSHREYCNDDDDDINNNNNNLNSAGYL